MSLVQRGVNQNPICHMQWDLPHPLSPGPTTACGTATRLELSPEAFPVRVWGERHGASARAAAAQVTVVPREKYPLGQTVTRVNEQRERTQMWSRRYLEEQLLTVLAGMLALPLPPVTGGAAPAMADQCGSSRGWGL